MTDSPRRGARLKHETYILLLALASGLPAVAIALLLLWLGDFSPRLQWTLTGLIGISWIGIAVSLRDRVVHPLQTIANMLAALHEGDYSIRAREQQRDDALGLAMLEVNTLGETLRQQRLDAVEATALLSKVMEEIDVALFTFDENQSLTLVNRGGERLLGKPREQLLGQTAAALHLDHCLTGTANRIMDSTFAGRMGRWELRRSRFREGGLPHQLVMLADLTHALRQEERQAWQRLVQVLRHEINNSLAPIRSLAGTLRRILDRTPRPEDWETDLKQGLHIITERSGALSRFMASYTKLTRLPEPELQRVSVVDWVTRTAKLETRLTIELVPGPRLNIHADGDQLDQLLINLVKNAVDAALETGGSVRVGWKDAGGTGPSQTVEVWVEDEGPGISNTDNLFVPFFTTKPEGSGIGLVLSRQIAEAHGGTLSLENRRGGPGCVARIRLPVGGAEGDGT